MSVAAEHAAPAVAPVRIDDGADAAASITVERRVDVRANVGWYRYGRNDPTTRLTPSTLARAMRTAAGPATVLVQWWCAAESTTASARAWGPGADAAVVAALEMTAVGRQPAPGIAEGHPLVVEAARCNPTLRAGASGDLYHELLPTILGQRITAGEAFAQWSRLVRRFADTAPGPVAGLLLPPPPADLARTPTWALHRLGIERKRAATLVEVARVADHLRDWTARPHAETAAKLALVRGVGPWTIGSVLGPACGDDDAVIVGDYHIPNTVAWNLAGEPRATDARMLELLAPYAGQRGRVVRLIGRTGHRAPAFGPKQRILPMWRW